MARIFLSHSSANNAHALALAEWLEENGWSDFFLDIDTDRGIVPGERWMAALAGAVERCEAVIFLVSPAWQASKFCFAEFFQAKNLGKRIFGVIVQPVELSTLPEQMTAEWQVCDLTQADSPVRYTVERPPLVPETTVTFSGAALATLSRGLAKAGLSPSTFVWPPESEPDRSPYPGLRALDEADAAVFFGRDAAIVRAMDQIRLVRERGVERLFVILGASGAGKSSFLRAGLLPRLRRDFEHFVVLPVLRPERAAISGAQGLLHCLQRALTAAGHSASVGEIRGELDKTGLAGILRRIEAGARPLDAGQARTRQTVIVPIDQGEELVAAEGQLEAQKFLALVDDLSRRVVASPISSTLTDVRVLFVMTIRSDSLPLLQGHGVLQGLAPVFFSLPAMPASEFKAVIEGPASRHTATVKPLLISPQLTEELVSDARGPDALPLLALTLEWLYREYTTAEGTRIGHDEYHRLGGVRGVIGKAVERALDRPGQEPSIPDKPADQERLLEQLFPLIATVDPDTEEWKRRVASRKAIQNAAPQADALVSRLVEQRLLLSDARPLGKAGESDEIAEVVEVTHEALLRQWDLLERWLRAFSADLSNAETIRRAANDWERSGRDEAMLVHTKGRLEAAETLLADVRLKGRFETVDERYLAACRARDRRELQEREAQLQRIAEQQADRARLQKRATAGLAAAALIVLAFVVWTVRQTQTVSRQTSLVLAGASESALDGQAPDSAVRLALLASADSFLRPAHPAALPSLNRAIVGNPLRRRFPHQAGGSYPAFSADGRTVITAVNGQSAAIWDVESGARIGAPIPQPNLFISATFSPDGSRVVIASLDEGRKVWDTRAWDARTGTPVSAPLQQQGSIWGMVFNRDGTRVLTIADAEHAQVWNAATWAPVGKRISHTNEILGARFSPDGTSFVTYAKDDVARLWATESGEPIGAPMVHESIPQSAEFSHDGLRILTTAVGNSARVWNAATGQPLDPTITSPVMIRDARFSPDGRTIAFVSDNQTASIADAGTGQSLARPMFHATHPKEIAYSKDGTRLVTLAEADTIQVWDAASGYAIGPALRGGPRLGVVAFSGDGKRVLARSTEAAYAWDASTGGVAAAPVLTSDPTRVKLLGDSLRAVQYDIQKPLALVDLMTGKPVEPAFPDPPTGSDVEVSLNGAWILLKRWSLDLQAKVDSMIRSTGLEVRNAQTGKATVLDENGFVGHAFSADSTRLLTISKSGLAVRDLEAGKPLGTPVPMPEMLLAWGFSADARTVRILTGRLTSSPQFIDPVTGTPLGAPLEAGQSVISAALSPRGDRVMTTSTSGEVILWDEPNRRLIRRLREALPMGPPTDFSADGRFILMRVKSTDPVRVLAADTGLPVVELSGKAPVFGAVFSRNSRFVITWSTKAAQVWDIDSGRPATTELAHRENVISADTTPDGRWLVTFAQDRAIRVWPLPAIDATQRAALRARACEALDPEARALRIEDIRTAPIIENARIGEGLCGTR